MDFTDVADAAVADPCVDTARRVRRMALVAHDRGNTVLGGGHLHQAGLFNRMRAGLLHIDVLAHLHRQHGDREVHMVRR